ncbi:hypothetical protein O181_027659 [Austropuccinia psidii MF-1]|uniref:Uncharacterized protein n=1 Tax=Austropuccinia psidii MF-1 TaxID=1389203 RepID=A0A9Q3H2U0_9BASI|nr:hypothetical protein [Austropuccinia psidii MF-1]
MNQQSTSYLPPFPEDTVEGQYAEEIYEEDQNVNIQSLLKEMKDVLLTKAKNKGKRKQLTTFNPEGSPVESMLPRHVIPEESLIPPNPVPRVTSTSVTER